MKPKHRSYYPRLCMLTRTGFSHSYGHNICTSTGHRLGCCISGACLMAIYKGTFCWHWKITVKFWSGKKRRRPFHYPLHSVLFSFTMPLIAAVQLGDIRICRFATRGLFCHMYSRSMRKKHVPLTASWCVDSSGDSVGNDNNNNNNNNNNNKGSRGMGEVAPLYGVDSALVLTNPGVQ